MEKQAVPKWFRTVYWIGLLFNAALLIPMIIAKNWVLAGAEATQIAILGGMLASTQSRK